MEVIGLLPMHLADKNVVELEKRTIEWVQGLQDQIVRLEKRVMTLEERIMTVQGEVYQLKRSHEKNGPSRGKRKKG